jgi:hypothetical protein
MAKRSIDFIRILRCCGGIRRAQDSERMSVEEAADALWREFISHAGIDHA